MNDDTQFHMLIHSGSFTKHTLYFCNMYHRLWLCNGLKGGRGTTLRLTFMVLVLNL